MTILKFYATWCAPCKTLSSEIEKVKDQLPDIREVDVEQEVDLAKGYAIRGVPTLILLDETGEEIKRRSGFMNSNKLLEWIKQ